MTADLQTMVALGCVAAAAIYLAWHAVRRMTKRGGCGGCGSCPSNATTAHGGTLVSLETSSKKS